MQRTSWGGFMVKLEQSRVERVLLRTVTIDAGPKSEQRGTHGRRSDIFYIWLSVLITVRAKLPTTASLGDAH